MLIRNKIVKDTAMLTAMQLILDTASILLNAFITRRLGTEAVGVITLTCSFIGLAGTFSSGNAFLCTSRLVSEELGRKNSNPHKVLMYGLMFCTILCSAVSCLIIGASDMICTRFFHSTAFASALRLMPAALFFSAYSACFKGSFNAFRRSSVTAAGDILEFAVRGAVTAVLAMRLSEPSDAAVCTAIIVSFTAGSFVSLAFFLIMYILHSDRKSGCGSLTLRRYISLAFPIMGGAVLTAALSGTNDALIPIMLRKSGASAGEALSRFGIFEAIVIPTLFFPSVVLCSMSGIIVSETAKASASGNTERIRSITQRLIDGTMIYSVISAAVLMRFGRTAGVLLGGGELAGNMIRLIAPVIPFIYLEIVLEAVIKGMGMQGFSSLNYLAEYIVRIGIVLTVVPRFGFIGIAASYYTSNVLGNCSRLRKVIRCTGIRFRPFGSVIVPMLYAVLTMGAAELALKLAGGCEGLPGQAAMTALWIGGYLAVFAIMGKFRDISIKADKTVVRNAQITI